MLKLEIERTYFWLTFGLTGLHFWDELKFVGNLE